MAFFSQREHNVKRSHSTERTNPYPTTSSAPRPSLPTRTKSSSRPKTIYDPHPTTVHVQGPDHRPPKLNSAPSTPRYSLRRVPVPSLSAQDVDKLPYGRTSPIIPSSRSTSISGKSSIADLGGVYNAALSKTKLDHLKSIGDTAAPTPPRSPSQHWESSSGSSRNPGGPPDHPEKTASPLSGLTVLVSSPKQVTASLSSPRLPSQKPQRAVLRRKSSAKQPKPQPSNQNLNHKQSKPDLGIGSATTTPKRAVPSAHHPPHSVSTPPPSDPAHRLRRSTSDEREPPFTGNVSSSPSSRVLTPAGAVAAAYKEQEKRKTYSKGPVRTNTGDLSRRCSYDETGGVYYTVFGSSGEVVAAGGSEAENRPHRELSNRISTKANDVSRKPSLGPLGRLSRKSSTKAKKNGASGFMSESECGHERITKDEEVRRASFQGRRSTSMPPKHRRKKSLGIAADSSDIGESPQNPLTPSKSAGWSVDEPSPSAGGKIWKLMKRLSTGGLRDKYQAQEAAPPVPALPEGLLSTPPPKSRSNPQSVPHSPNDSKPPASRYVRGRSSFGDAALMNRHTATRGFPNPLPSSQPLTLGDGKNPSRRRQSTNTRSSSPMSPDLIPSRFWQKSRSSSVSTFEEVPPLPERIVNERILSPFELSKLEREQAMAELSSQPSTVDSHSPAASTSNHHGNTLIITRNPSLRGLHSQASGEDSETDGMSALEFVALPTPPRHHYKSNPHPIYHQSNGSSPAVGSVSTSPTIPMFSTQDAVNQFQLTKGGGTSISRSLNSSLMSQSPVMSPDDFGSVKPPPRPRRSDKRKPPAADQHIATRASLDRGGNRNKRVPPSTSASLPRERTFGLSSGLEDGDGRSYGTFGTSHSKGLVELVKMPRDSSSSREDFAFSSSIHSKSPLKFREMGSGEGEGKVLTEKEKADRWHDLLERSDRAGGTIHIGNTKLPSDSLRFSDYSTLTALAL